MECHTLFFVWLDSRVSPNMGSLRGVKKIALL